MDAKFMNNNNKGFILVSMTMNRRPARRNHGQNIAGNGNSSFAGDGGPAVNAMLKGPMGIHHAPQGSGAPTLTRVNEIY
jgi:hypothetical protein